MRGSSIYVSQNFVTVNVLIYLVELVRAKRPWILGNTFAIFVNIINELEVSGVIACVDVGWLESLFVHGQIFDQILCILASYDSLFIDKDWLFERQVLWRELIAWVLEKVVVPIEVPGRIHIQCRQDQKSKEATFVVPMFFEEPNEIGWALKRPNFWLRRLTLVVVVQVPPISRLFYWLVHQRKEFFHFWVFIFFLDWL